MLRGCPRRLPNLRVVEIDGQRELPPACHTLLRPGQVIHTKSQRVVTARRTLLELAIGGTKSGSDRAIPTRLDELVAEYGANPLRFSGAGKPRSLVQNDPLLVRDLVRCIRCDRCWRYCDANQAIGAIKPVGRGLNSSIATFSDAPLTATACQHCGACASVCPTGAISERGAPNRAKPSAEAQPCVRTAGPDARSTPTSWMAGSSASNQPAAVRSTTPTCVSKDVSLLISSRIQTG